MHLHVQASQPVVTSNHPVYPVSFSTNPSKFIVEILKVILCEYDQITFAGYDITYFISFSIISIYFLLFMELFSD